MPNFVKSDSTVQPQQVKVGDVEAGNNCPNIAPSERYGFKPIQQDSDQEKKPWRIKEKLMTKLERPCGYQMSALKTVPNLQACKRPRGLKGDTSIQCQSQELNP